MEKKGLLAIYQPDVNEMTIIGANSDIENEYKTEIYKWVIFP